MKTAETFANLSTARRKKVGAIIVKDNRIISIGYNGTPSGWDNNCEDKIYTSPWGSEYIDEEGITYSLKTKPEVIHAERNALDKLAKHSGGAEGAYMFVTCSPCLECAKSIYTTGIQKVFYGEDYRTDEGINFLKKCGVDVEKI